MTTNSIEEWVKLSFPQLELRPYQIESWSSLERVRTEGRDKALLHLATGLGKTFVAAVDALRYRESCSGPVMFVSHMNDISDQAVETFRSLKPELKLKRFRVNDESYRDADIVFATFQSLVKSLSSMPSSHFSYIIWDEAHHIEAATFKRVCEHFSPKFALGLTATPDRTDSKDIRGYFGDPIFSKRLASGIAEGWLADVEYRIVFDDAVKKAIEDRFQPRNIMELRNLFNVTPRNDAIANDIQAERAKIGLGKDMTIVFCSTVDQADEMAKLLNGKAYHSGQSKTVREKLLTEFRSGTISTLCTRDMFNEGIDIPDARLIVFMRSTASSIIFEQQLGRGLRRTKDKTQVTILDFAANIRRIVQVRELEQSIKYEVRGTDGRFTITDGTASYKGKADDTIITLGNHAKFSFDQLAVSLLEQYDNFNAPDEPPGYLTLRKLAKHLGVSPEFINTIIIKHGIQAALYKLRGSGRVYRMLSPQQITLVTQIVNGDNTDKSDESIISLHKLSRNIRCSVKVLEDVCKEVNAPVSIYRFEGRRPGKGVKVDYVDAIKRYYFDTSLYTILEASEELSITVSSLKRHIARTGVLPKRRLGKLYLTKSQINILKTVNRNTRKPIPLQDILRKYDETQSINMTARHFGVSWNAIKKRLSNSGKLCDQTIAQN